MTPHEDPQHGQARPQPELISDEVICDVVSTVLALRHGEPANSPTIDLVNWTGLRLDAIGADSLAIAEIVVELEQRLGVLLELHIRTGLDTLGQLRDALYSTDAA